MTRGKKTGKSGDDVARPPREVRLPRFITEEEIGLGDVIKKATSYFGIRPCGGCDRRADMLNRWTVFTPRQPR